MSLPTELYSVSASVLMVTGLVPDYTDDDSIHYETMDDEGIVREVSIGIHYDNVDNADFFAGSVTTLRYVVSTVWRAPETGDSSGVIVYSELWPTIYTEARAVVVALNELTRDRF